MPALTNSTKLNYSIEEEHSLNRQLKLARSIGYVSQKPSSKPRGLIEKVTKLFL